MNAIKIALIASAVTISSAALASPIKMTDAEMSQIVAGQPPADSRAWKQTSYTDGNVGEIGSTQIKVTCLSTGKNCTGIALIDMSVKTKVAVDTTVEKKGWQWVTTDSSFRVTGDSYKK